MSSPIFFSGQFISLVDLFKESTFCRFIQFHSFLFWSLLFYLLCIYFAPVYFDVEVMLLKAICTHAIFLLSSIPKCFPIARAISSSPTCYLENCCLIPSNVCLLLISTLIPFGQNILCLTLILLPLLIFAEWPGITYPEVLHVPWRRCGVAGWLWGFGDVHYV